MRVFETHRRRGNYVLLGLILACVLGYAWLQWPADEPPGVPHGPTVRLAPESAERDARTGPPSAVGALPGSDGVAERTRSDGAAAEPGAPSSEMLVRVVDARSNPIAGARVRARDPLGGTDRDRVAELGSTDVAGQLRIARAELIEAYGSVLLEALSPADGAVRTFVRADARDVRLVLLPYGRADLRVVDESGAPVEGARIAAAERERLNGADALTSEHEWITDGAGIAELRGLAVGRLECIAAAPGFAARVADVDIHAALEAPQTIVLRPGSGLNVRVVEPSGAPVEGAWVRADETSGLLGIPADSARSGADGIARLQSLDARAERLQLHATAPLHVSAGLVLEPGWVAAGEIEIVLAPACAVLVRARDPHGRSIPLRAQAYVEGDGSPWRETPALANGHGEAGAEVSLDGLPHGVALGVRVRAGAFCVGWFGGLVLTPGEQRRLELRLPELAALDIALRESDGAPTSAAVLLRGEFALSGLEPNADRVARDVIEVPSSGRARAWLPRGTYAVDVRAAGTGIQQSLLLDRDRTLELAIAPPARIEGRVVDENGAPHAERWVGWVAESRSSWALCDESGAFRFELPHEDPSGLRWLACTREGLVVELGAPRAVSGATVELVLDVVPRRGSLVDVESGRRISGWVRIEPTAGGSYDAPPLSRGEIEVGADGTFAFELPRGSWRAVGVRAGYQSYATAISRDDDSSMQIGLFLGRRCTVPPPVGISGRATVTVRSERGGGLVWEDSRDVDVGSELIELPFALPSGAVDCTWVGVDARVQHRIEVR